MPEIQSVDPPYVQVVRHITEQIAQGELAPGDRIPSERELREQWGISKATANKVVAQLKAEGLVFARVGVGTVVASQSGVRGAGPRSMWQRIRSGSAIRMDNERAERRTGWAYAKDVPEIVQASLGGTIESDYVFRRRVIYRDDSPCSVATSWFLPALVDQWPGTVDRLLADEPIPQGTPAFIADRMGRDLDSCVDYVEALGANDDIARDLQIEPGSPVLRVVSSVSAEGWVIEVGDYYYPARTSVTYTYAI